MIQLTKNDPPKLKQLIPFLQELGFIEIKKDTYVWRNPKYPQNRIVIYFREFPDPYIDDIKVSYYCEKTGGEKGFELVTMSLDTIRAEINELYLKCLIRIV